MRRFILLILLSFFHAYLFAQTAPVSKTVPFTENFGNGFVAGSFPVPNSIVTYQGDLNSYQTAVDDIVFSNMTLSDVFVQDVISVDGSNVATTVSGGNGPYCYVKNDNAALLFSLSNRTYAAAFTADATNKSEIRVSYEVRLTEMNTTVVGYCFLQYRTGGSGDWSSLSGTTYSTYGQSVGDSVSFSCIELPSTVDGVSMLEFRLLTYQSDSVNVLNGDVLSFAIDDIKITSAPETPVVYNANDSICGSGTIRFLVNNTVSGLTFNWYDNNSILLTSDSTDFTTSLLTSSGVYFVETSNDTCSSPRITLNAVVNTVPSAPIIVNPLITICGAGNIDFQVTPVATQYNWYASSVGGSSLLNNTLYSSTLSGSVETVWAEAYNNGCYSDRVMATGISYTVPGIPVLDASVKTICGPASSIVSFSVTGATSPHYYWYNVSTSGTSQEDNLSHIVTITGTSKTVWVEANSGYCSSGRTTATGNRFNIPGAAVLDASVKTICGSGSLMFTVTNVNTHYYWYTVSTGGVSLADIQTYTLTGSGSVWVERGNNNCISNTRTMATGIFYTVPSVPVLTSPTQTICGTGTLSYTISNPSLNNNWYTVSTGGVSLSNNSLYILTISGSGTTNTLWIEANSGYCSSSRITATGISYNIPAIPVLDVSIQTICGSGSLTYNVTNPSTHNNWYTVSTGGVALADNSSYTLTTSGIVWVEKASSRCTNPTRVMATGTFYTVPGIPVLDNPVQTICGSGSLTYNVTNPSIHNNWYTVSIGGVSLTDSPNYTLSTTGTIWVESASNNCINSNRTMATGIFYTVPGVPVLISPTQTICGTGTLSYTISNPSLNNNWYTVSTGGVSLSNNSSYILTISGSGTTNTLWVEANSGYCSSSRVTATGISYNIPAIPVLDVSIQTICGSASLTYNVTNPSTHNNWYTVSTGGVALADNSGYTLTASGIIWVEKASSRCTNPTRVMATGVFYTVPGIPVLDNQSQTICGSGTLTYNVTNPSTHNNWYTVSVGGVSLADNPNYTLTTTGTIWVESSSNNCINSNRVMATGIFYTVPGMPVLDNPLQTICGSGSLTYNITNPSIYNNWYTVSVGGSSLTDNLSYILSISGSSSTLWVEANSGYCSSSRVTATGISYNIPAIPVLDAGIQTICGSGSLAYNVTNPSTHNNWYTVSTGGVSLVDNSSYTLTASGIVWVEKASTRCTNPTRVMATGVFYTVPGIPVLDNPVQTICGSGSLTYNVTNPSIHNNWYTVSIGGVSLADSPNYTLSITGTLWVESASNNCINSNRVMAIGIFYTVPGIPVLDNPIQTICGSGSLTYNVTNPSIQNNWYTVSIGGVSLADSPNYTLSTTGAIWVESASNNCTNSTRVMATGTFYTVPGIPVLDNPIQTICGSGSLTYNVTNPSIQNNWYTISVGGVSLADSPNYTLSTTGTLWVESSSNNCTNSNRVMATGIFYTVPGIPVLDNPLQTICGSGSLTYNITNPSIYNNWYTVSVGGPSLADNLSYILSISGSSNTLWVEANSGYCSSGRVTATGISYNIPAIPVLDASIQTICGSGSLTYNVTNPSTHNNWYTVSTSGVSLADNSSYVLSISGSSNTLWVEANSGYCSSGRVTVIGVSYNIPSLPVLDASMQTICGSGSLTYNVTNPSTHNNWYTVSTGGVSLADNSSYTLTTSGIVWVEKSSSRCSNPARVMATGIFYTVPGIPVLDAGIQTICGSGSLTYNVTNPSIHNNWYTVSVSGVSLADSPTYTLTTTGTMWVESASNSCTNPIRVMATGIFYNMPEVPVLDNPIQTICGSGSLTYNVTNPSIHTNWYTVSTGGVSLVDNASYTLTTTGTLWVESASNSCTNSSRVMVTGIFYTVPGIPVLDNPIQTICGSGSLIYHVMNPSIHNNWYTVSVGGVSVSDNPNYTLITNGIIWVESASNTCVNSNRVMATGAFYTVPGIPVLDKTVQTICGPGSLTYNVINPSAYNKWYTVSTGGISLLNNPAYTLTLSGTSGTIWVEASSGYCSSARVKATGDSYLIPSIPVLDANVKSICGNTLTFNVTNNSEPHYFWYTTSVGGVSLTDNAFYTTPYKSNTQYSVWVEANSNKCTSARVKATGTYFNVPVTPLFGTNVQSICGNNTLSFVVANATEPHYLWYSSSVGGISLKDSTSYTTVSPTRVTLWVEAFDNTCSSARVSISGISYYVPPAPVLDASVKSICGNRTLTFSVANNTENHYYWYSSSVGGTLLTDSSSFITPVKSNTQYNVWVEAYSGYCTSLSRTKATGNYYNEPTTPLFDTQVESVCGNNTLSFSIANNTEPHYLWYSNSTGGIPLKDSTRYTTVSTGKVIVWVESFDNRCPSERVSISGVSYYVPLAPVLDATVKSICGNNTLTFTISANTESHYYWYTSSVGGVLLKDSSSYITPAKSNTQYTVWVEANSGHCTSLSRTKATGNYYPIPASPQLDAYVKSICGSGTLTFSVTNNSQPHYLWYATSLGGTSLIENTSYTTPTKSNTQYNVWVEANSGYCSSLRTKAVSNFYHIPAAPVLDATVKSICGNNTLSFSATPIEPHYYWYTVSTGGSSLTDNSTYTTPALYNTEYNVWVEANSDHCTGGRTMAKGIYYYVPALPVLDASVKSICGHHTLTFSTTPVEPHYYWYTVSTGGSSFIDNPVYTSPALYDTQYSVWLEANSGYCSSSRVKATGDFYYIPAVPVLDAAVKSICGNNTLSFSTTPVEPHYYWYTVSIGGSSLIDNSTYTTPSLYDTEYSVWVEANSNHCTSDRTMATGIYHYVPALPVLDANVKSICGNNTLSFSATPVEPHYYWYTVSTGGSSLLDNPTYTSPSLYDTRYNVWVEANSNYCSGPRAKAIGDFYYIPAVPVLDAAVKSICGNNTLSFSATPIEPHYYWYTVSTGGSSLIDNSAYTTPSLYDTEYSVWVEANSNHCTSDRTMAIGKYYAIPSMPAVSNPVDSLCGPGSITFKISPSAGLNYYWYSVSIDGGVISNAINYTTPDSTSSQSYWVESNDGYCTSDRVFTFAKIKQLPDPTITISVDTLWAVIQDASYQWAQGSINNTIPGANTSILNINYSGGYFVHLKGVNGCTITGAYDYIKPGGDNIYYEGFQDGMPANYTLLNLDNAAIVDVAGFAEIYGTHPWAVVPATNDPTSTFFGGINNKVASATSIFKDKKIDANRWMITDTISLNHEGLSRYDMIHNTAISIQWQAISDDAGDYPDSYDFLISTTTKDPLAFKTLLPVKKESTTKVQNHKIDSIPVEYNGKKVFLAFQLNTPRNKGDRLMIDNILVLAKTRKITLNEVTGLTNERNEVSAIIAPNPATELAILRYSISYPSEVKILVYDVLGHTMLSHNAGFVAPGENVYEVNLSDFKKGFYLVRIDSDTGSKVLKLIVDK